LLVICYSVGGGSNLSHSSTTLAEVSHWLALIAKLKSMVVGFDKAEALSPLLWSQGSLQVC
jgi:hypothetical protein